MLIHGRSPECTENFGRHGDLIDCGTVLQRGHTTFAHQRHVMTTQMISNDSHHFARHRLQGGLTKGSSQTAPSTKNVTLR